MVAAAISTVLLASIGHARTGLSQHVAIAHLKETITRAIGAENNTVEM
jgi:hypothetical protein